MNAFLRFPHTPHLAWLGEGAPPRDDKVLSKIDREALLSHDVVVEEKLDGANLGISVAPDGNLRAQNRGQYLKPPYQGQFVRLEKWLQRHEDTFFDALGENLIAFGEWCGARHSLDYSALPDWWLLFDIYDRSKQTFWSTVRRTIWAANCGVETVPTLFRGRTNLSALQSLVNTCESRFRSGEIEGVVIRAEDDSALLNRAKLVRADFLQTIDSHWRSRMLEWNRLRMPAITDHQIASLLPSIQIV